MSFTANGRQIKSFLNGFRSAAVKIGLDSFTENAETGEVRYSGITRHDMRQSASRNMKAGVSESEGMSISGHRTNSTYKSYLIIDEDMQRSALEKTFEHQKLEAEKRKVVPIRKGRLKLAQNWHN